MRSPQPLEPPPLRGEKCRLAQRRDTFIQAGEARVSCVPAHVAGVDLLDDDGDLVDPEAIIEEHAGHVVPGLVGVPGDQFLPG